MKRLFERLMLLTKNKGINNEENIITANKYSTAMMMIFFYNLNNLYSKYHVECQS